MQMRLIEFYMGNQLENTLALIREDRIACGASFSSLLFEMRNSIESRCTDECLLPDMDICKLLNVLSKLAGFYAVCHTETRGIKKIMGAILAKMPDIKTLEYELFVLRSSSTTYENFTLNLGLTMLNDPNASNSC